MAIKSSTAVRMHRYLSFGYVTRFAVWLLLAACAGFAACAGCIYDHDVSKKRESWGEFAIGQVYETNVDLLLTTDIVGPGLTIGSENRKESWAMMYGGDVSVAEFRKDPGRWPTIDGLVPKGTKLRIAEIHKRGSHSIFVNLIVGDSAWYFVKAQILEGQFGGELVELSSLTKHHTNGSKISDVNLDPYTNLVSLVKGKSE